MQCAMEGGSLSCVLHCNVPREGVRYGMQCVMEGGALSCVLHCYVPPPPAKMKKWTAELLIHELPRQIAKP
jgi:hypothetical protein